MPMNPALAEAYNAIRAGNRARAVELLKAEIQSNPNNADAWYLMSYALSDPTRQIQSLERAVKADPGHTAAARRLAELRGQPSFPDIDDIDVSPPPPSSPPPAKPKRRRFPVLVVALVILVVVLLVGGGIVLILRNVNINPITVALANPTAADAGQFPPEAEAALRDYVRRNQGSRNYQIVSSMYAPVPDSFRVMFSARVPDQAWCVIIDPPVSLESGFSNLVYDHFVVTAVQLDWQVGAFGSTGVQDDKNVWLRGGCSNWDQTLAQTAPDERTELLRQWLPGVYENHSDREDVITLGAGGSVTYENYYTKLYGERLTGKPSGSNNAGTPQRYSVARHD